MIRAEKGGCTTAFLLLRFRKCLLVGKRFLYYDRKVKEDEITEGVRKCMKRQKKHI